MEPLNGWGGVFSPPPGVGEGWDKGMYLKKIKFNNKFLLTFACGYGLCLLALFCQQRKKVLLLLLLTSPYSKHMPKGSQILKRKIDVRLLPECHRTNIQVL